MADRPIIFSGPMVRALLDGRKTQTRRVLKHKSIEVGIAPRVEVDHPAWIQFLHPQGGPLTCVKWPYAPGDRLWVRETWSAMMDHGWTIADARRRMFNEKIVYRADGNGYEYGDGWWPSIHMPREFSRLTLAVTEVRVQRLQDISEDDAAAEGVHATRVMSEGYHLSSPSFVESFRGLWNSLHGPEAWDANPWVVALTFTVQRGNIDQIGKA